MRKNIPSNAGFPPDQQQDMFNVLCLLLLNRFREINLEEMIDCIFLLLYFIDGTAMFIIK